MSRPSPGLRRLTQTTPAFAANGLVTAVVCDARSGDVLMVAHMDRRAWEETLRTGLATFYSRSRRQLWRKGATSGNLMRVLRVRLDCDADAVLLDVDCAGPACHTGARSCFFVDVAEAESRVEGVPDQTIT